MKALFSKKSDYLLTPIYYLQAKRVAKTTLRLAEPMGVRHYHTDSLPTVAILGDSAAAGVGVSHQDDAPFGRINHHLCAYNAMTSCQLHATSGHTSFDLLTRLYAMPSDKLDVAIISIGVNDVVKATSDTAWQDNLRHIITLLGRKFHTQHIVFLSLPPMQLAPSLPTPLNHFIGRRAAQLSTLMQKVCHEHDGVHYLTDEFAEHGLNRHAMFAKDGFHPSQLTYDIWSKTIAHHVAKLLAHNT